MEEKILKILKENFKGQNIDKARKELCFLFRVVRTDEPKCPDCGSENLSNIGGYFCKDGMTGNEYFCDECSKEFDFDNYS